MAAKKKNVEQVDPPAAEPDRMDTPAPKKAARILVREHTRTVKPPVKSDFTDDLADVEETPVVEKTPEPEAPKPPKHGTHMLNMARDLGLTDAEIDQYEPGELGAYVAAAIRTIKQHANQGEPRVQREQRQPEPVVEEPIKLNFDESQYDENIVNEFKSEKKARIEAEKRLARLEQQLASNANQTFSQAVDAGFSALNRPDLFGTGPITGMTKDDLNAQRRMGVWESLRTNPMPGVTITEAIQRRAKALYQITDKPAAAVPKKVDAAIEGYEDEDDTPIEPVPSKIDPLAARKKEWSEGGVAKPTNRSGAKKESLSVSEVKRDFVRSVRAKGLDGALALETSTEDDDRMG